MEVWGWVEETGPRIQPCSSLLRRGIFENSQWWHSLFHDSKSDRPGHLQLSVYMSTSCFDGFVCTLSIPFSPLADGHKWLYSCLETETCLLPSPWPDKECRRCCAKRNKVGPRERRSLFWTNYSSAPYNGFSPILSLSLSLGVTQPFPLFLFLPVFCSLSYYHILLK